MYHSLTFGNKNTWDNWHIVPESRPVINLPEPKTSYVDIPGMDGSLDYTEALSGRVKYGQRQGSWTFYVMNDYGEKNYEYEAWYQLYAAITDCLHGKNLLVWSEDDPDYVFSGRFSVEWASPKDWSKVTITYILDPYKYKGYVDENGNVIRDTENSTSGLDWKWDELFDLTIKYGKFEVTDEKWRTLYNDTDHDIEIYMELQTKMTIEFNGETKEFGPGIYRDSGIILTPGENKMRFIGTGQVLIDYDKYGKMI